jgi:hypothetical protein
MGAHSAILRRSDSKPFHTVPNGVLESASKCDLSVKIAGQAYLDASVGVTLATPGKWSAVDGGKLQRGWPVKIGHGNSLTLIPGQLAATLQRHPAAVSPTMTECVVQIGLFVRHASGQSFGLTGFGMFSPATEKKGSANRVCPAAKLLNKIPHPNAQGPSDFHEIIQRR